MESSISKVPYASETNPALSIISVVSNKEQCEEWLEAGLNIQLFKDYELILVNNENNSAFQDARAALNAASKMARGKYFVYIHQDLKLLESNALAEIYKYAEQLEDFGVLGVAGAPINYHQPICSSAMHGKKQNYPGIKVNIPTKVMTVDECLFVISRDNWIGHPFSGLSGWHLYAVEYCLNMLEKGKDNYVIPINAWHASEGLGACVDYCKSLKTFLRLYSDKFKYVNTTMKPWRTDWIGMIYLQYYTVKQYIKMFVKK